MSLFSRFFRKAPPAPPVPEAPVRPSAPAARPAARHPDRAREAAQEEASLQAAIERNDAETISRLVVAGKSTKVRQLAAHAVSDPAQLRDLIREVRGGNDKSVYKILTAKRDVQLGETRKHEQLQEEINTAAAAVERHSHRPYDALFGPTLDQLEIRWQARGPAGGSRARRKSPSGDRSRTRSHCQPPAADRSGGLTPVGG